MAQYCGTYRQAALSREDHASSCRLFAFPFLHWLCAQQQCRVHYRDHLNIMWQLLSLFLRRTSQCTRDISTTHKTCFYMRHVPSWADRLQLLPLLSTEPLELCVCNYPLRLPLLSFVSSAIRTLRRKEHEAFEIAHALYNAVPNTNVILLGAWMLELLHWGSFAVR